MTRKMEIKELTLSIDGNIAILLQEDEPKTETAPAPLESLEHQNTSALSSFASFLGLLGVAGGIDRETIRLWPGTLWLAVLLIILDRGSKPWQR